MDRIGRQAHICVYQKDIADYFYQKYGYKKYAINVQAVYKKTDYVELISRSLGIRPLSLAHLEWVHEHNGHLDYDYLKKRLGCGAIYGGYLGGELCSSVGVHAEGALGILKVLENLRRQGFALEIVGHMVNILLDRGEVPFSQIEFDNIASIGLHKKLGFEISTDTL
jgi:GNAT superfamily N-acetyltransferase